MDWSAAGSGFGGVIIGSGIVLLVIRAKFDRLAELEKTVEVDQATRLKENEAEVAELKTHFAVTQATVARHEQMLENVNPALISSQIQALGEQLSPIEGKLDRLLTGFARLEERQNSAQVDINRAHDKISRLTGKP